MASIIKTDNIQKVSDDSNIIKKCGSTTTVGSGAGNTITVDGATVTLGRCGGTVSLASGATQTGFGQTYSAVEYCTTAKTSPFTAASGIGYFVNTSSGAITVTLPSSPSAGDILAIADYASSFGSNNVTLCRNGSKINANCFNATLRTAGQSVTLIYVDGTRGWKTVTDSTANVTGQGTHIIATGGTITTCGDYKIHTFTGDGCFAVTAGTCAPNNEVSYLVVAGGGGSPYQQGGGGGAGGFREDRASNDSYSVSPLEGAGSITVTSQGYPITVGAGGAGGTPGNSNTSSPGSNSIFNTITSAGGGNGAPSGPFPGGAPGGSGGGAGENAPGPGSNGNQPPVSPPQGNPGGTGIPNQGGGAGGGGAGAAGGAAIGAGGAGVSTSITGSSVARAGGGGGGGYPVAPTPGGAGGSGGGGAAGTAPNSPPYAPATSGTPGTANTGGGGGSGSYPNTTGGSGGSGVVIIRYKYQN